MDYTSARVVLSLRSDVIRSHQPDLFQGQVSGDLQLRDQAQVLDPVFVLELVRPVNGNFELSLLRENDHLRNKRGFRST